MGRKKKQKDRDPNWVLWKEKSLIVLVIAPLSTLFAGVYPVYPAVVDNTRPLHFFGNETAISIAVTRGTQRTRDKEGRKRGTAMMTVILQAYSSRSSSRIFVLPFFLYVPPSLTFYSVSRFSCNYSRHRVHAGSYEITLAFLVERCNALSPATWIGNCGKTSGTLRSIRTYEEEEDFVRHGISDFDGSFCLVNRDYSLYRFIVVQWNRGIFLLNLSAEFSIEIRSL